MLHEINKSLSKLTEETFKKQLNKSGNSDVEESRKARAKSESEICGDKENKINKVSIIDISKNIWFIYCL